LLSKPILDGNVFSFDPSKLAQLLPERIQEDRATGRSAIIQDADAEDFARLRRGRRAKRKEHRANDKAASFIPHELLLLFFIFNF
jgi:hypothetical protein